ncbi:MULTISPECIES: hypothetical protein [unclassified Salipiger]|uniref:tetratricopeptide repeat protein n=1 Tax=unclassified Salipiger TaxID=2640570 RepID=UPI0013B6493E|nr:MULTISPECIES: hypothetical protein [unclassified Salipiger]NDV49534.1 hypothetical protein [Salipiger sp. PrR003]NDW34396.1 hypothetical protein [Salipiger sp. PrR007]
MSILIREFKSRTALALALITFCLPGAAVADRAEELLTELATASSPEIADRAERDLFNEWSKSGSPAMDLLLTRGRDALEVSDFETAIEHLTALTDHAPDFAEGWSTLALAYYATDSLGPAMDALEHTLALNPNHFGALQGVGAIHEELGDLDLAYRAYSRVVELRPFDSDVTEAIERLETRVNGVSL